MGFWSRPEASQERKPICYDYLGYHMNYTVQIVFMRYIDGLLYDYDIPVACAVEIPQSGTKPWAIYRNLIHIVINSSLNMYDECTNITVSYVSVGQS